MKNIIYLAALQGLEKHRYEFFCTDCGCGITLLTGYGRYGNLGSFCCPSCSKSYHATCDDYKISKAYIHEFTETDSKDDSLRKTRLLVTLDDLMQQG